VRVVADRQCGGVVARLRGGGAVQLDGLLVEGDRPEQQRHGHRQPQPAGADRGRRGPADSHPDRDRGAVRAGRDVGVNQRGTEAPVPGERVLRADLEQQAELLAEQVRVVGQVVPEQGKDSV